MIIMPPATACMTRPTFRMRGKPAIKVWVNSAANTNGTPSPNE